MSSVTELKTQVSVLQITLGALDTHTCSLPSAATIHGVVSESATAPLAVSVRDLSHRVAGIPTALASTNTPNLNRHRNVTVQAAQPTPPHASRENKPNSAHNPPALDPDVPRFDPSSTVFYSNPHAYAT